MEAAVKSRPDGAAEVRVQRVSTVPAGPRVRSPLPREKAGTPGYESFIREASLDIPVKAGNGGRAGARVGREAVERREGRSKS